MARNLARSSSGTRRVLGQREHAGVEVEPRQLAVQEALGRVGRSGRRPCTAVAPASRGRVLQPGHRTMRTPGIPVPIPRRCRRARRCRGIVREGHEHRPPVRRAHAVRAARLRPGGQRLWRRLPSSCRWRARSSSRARPAPARGKVLLFLLITMTPFVHRRPGARPGARPHEGRAPPLPDRRRPRAAPCCASRWRMYISKPAPEGLLVYPLAFGVLVLPEGERDRQERARAGPGERRRRARHRQLAPGAHQRDRARSSARAPAFVVYKLFGADWSLRFGAVVFVVATILAIQIPRTRLREPADEHEQQLEREEMHTAEHPARFERDGRAAGERRLPGVLRRVLAQGRSRRVGRRRRRRLRRQLRRCARRAQRSRRSVREEVILASSLVLPAVFTLLGALVGGFGRLRARRVARSGSAPRPGGSGSTASCSATVPTRCAGGRSPSSRRASSSCG